jgi:hypothetical protein
MLPSGRTTSCQQDQRCESRLKRVCENIVQEYIDSPRGASFRWIKKLQRRENGMKRCAHCCGRFGLIRYTAYRAFGDIIQFCRKKCEAAYFDERRKEAQSPPVLAAIKKEASRVNFG